MTTNLTPPQQAACLQLLESTYGQALGWDEQDDMRRYLALIDPDNHYPPAMIYTAVQRVCATFDGYAPKPATINATLADMARSALAAAPPAAPAPGGMDAATYTAWVKQQRRDMLAQAYPPTELDAATHHYQPHTELTLA